jgi:hypothetical protein
MNSELPAINNYGAILTDGCTDFFDDEEVHIFLGDGSLRTQISNTVDTILTSEDNEDKTRRYVSSVAEKINIFRELSKFSRNCS